jgi:hypothetical protein
MSIQQPKHYQPLQTTNWISATCVTTATCVDAVDTVSIIKSTRPRQRKTQLRAILLSARFLTLYHTTAQTVKSNKRGSVYLLLAINKLVRREAPLALIVIQVLQLHKRAVGLWNTFYFRVQETQDAWFKRLSFCHRFGEGMWM